MSVRIIYQDGSSTCHSATLADAERLIGTRVYPDPDGEAKLVVDVRPEVCPIGSAGQLGFFRKWYPHHFYKGERRRISCYSN